MRFEGTLKSWNDERGFGFIEPTRGGQEIFVHIKSFPAGTGRPTVGLPVSFEVELGPQGKKRAKAVQFAPQSRRRQSPRVESAAPWTLLRVIAIPAFAALYWYVSSHWSVKPVVALAYALASTIAFMAYALDKSAAIQSRWRVSESTLHFLGLACGWPGALIAQQLLRHKTSKRSFLATFWVTVLANVAGFYIYHASLATVLRSRGLTPWSS